MKTMAPASPDGSTGAPGGGKSPRAPFRPSSWLEGLGIGAGPPPPRRWHVAAPSIADDIRNDRELFPGGDVPPRPASPGGPTRARLPRGSSFQKMESLQKEVDLALELFAREAGGGDRPPGGPPDGAPGTVATSSSASVATDPDNELGDAHSAPGGHGWAPSLARRAGSVLALPLSLLPSLTAMDVDCAEDDRRGDRFEDVVSRELDKICLFQEQKRNIDFDNLSLRNAMEPFLAAARIRREEARRRVLDALEEVLPGRRTSASYSELPLHIGSTYGVPYPALRGESPFLYDVESFPLGQILAETMGVDDLSGLHVARPVGGGGTLAAPPAGDVRGRERFRRCFDSFVTSVVVPLLHSRALSEGVFYTNRHQLRGGRAQRIVYRYQAFPRVDVVRPGECPAGPGCDLDRGHSIGSIRYHVPLTPAFGTNALYSESRPGREDWHPLAAQSPGLGFQFDGARCLHFGLRNETCATRVSLDFRVAVSRAPEPGDVPHDPDDQLCPPELLKDGFSLAEPGYYDEVVVGVGRARGSFTPGPAAAGRGGCVSVVG